MTEDEIRRVLDHYDLGRLISAQRVERGFVNENWVLQTTCGRYFLKRRHPSLRNTDLVHAQHTLIRRLRQFGFPAPNILAAGSGETLLVLDGELYEIQEFIEGAPYEHASWANLRAAAVMLARYHTSVQGFTIQALGERGDLYSPKILTENLTSLKGAWALDQEPTLTRILQQLESHATDLAARFAEHEELPHLVIHGDYYGGNLLFKGDRIVGVVDYDKACWQPRIVELAEALIYFASPLLRHLKHLVYSGFIEWDRFTSLLRHYTCAISSNARASVQDPIALRPGSGIVGARSLEEACLGANELRALPDYIRCIWLSTSLQRLLEQGPQPADAQEILREVLALGDWSAAHTQRMIETGNRVMAAMRRKVCD